MAEETNNNVAQRNSALASHELYRKSTILDTLHSILDMRDKIKIISDMAFEAVDDNHSGDLDIDELSTVLRNVAKEMRLNPPGDNDIIAVLDELDQDKDH